MLGFTSLLFSMEILIFHLSAYSNYPLRHSSGMKTSDILFPKDVRVCRKEFELCGAREGVCKSKSRYISNLVVKELCREEVKPSSVLPQGQCYCFTIVKNTETTSDAQIKLSLMTFAEELQALKKLKVKIQIFLIFRFETDGTVQVYNFKRKCLQQV